MANNYNKVYERLVSTDKDYVGMLAYAIYKRQKIEFIKEHKLNNSGQKPTDTELDNFHTLALQPSQLEMYKKQAVSLTQGMTNTIIANKKNEIQEFIDGNLNNKGFISYMYGVSQSLVASALWLIIVAIVAIILWSMQNGPFETIKAIINSKK